MQVSNTYAVVSIVGGDRVVEGTGVEGRAVMERRKAEIAYATCVIDVRAFANKDVRRRSLRTRGGVSSRPKKDDGVRGGLRARLRVRVSGER